LSDNLQPETKSDLPQDLQQDQSQDVPQDFQQDSQQDSQNVNAAQDSQDQPTVPDQDLQKNEQAAQDSPKRNKTKKAKKNEKFLDENFNTKDPKEPAQKIPEWMQDEFDSESADDQKPVLGKKDEGDKGQVPEWLKGED